MTDFRLRENRRHYFSSLYAMNLEHRVMPGLVYLYMPVLSRRLDWDAEDRLWFAFLNGLTQNPITSLVMMEQLPGVPYTAAPGNIAAPVKAFEDWFNANWDRLQFDTDRRYQKKMTVEAIQSYAAAVAKYGSQVDFLSGSYKTLWQKAKGLSSFGRLATFSYLEYVYIMGHGADCDDLLFGDKDGSRSHRNGMLLLHGADHLVWDKRADNGFKGAYKDLPALARQMDEAAAAFLGEFKTAHRGDQFLTEHAGNFTLESNLCTFKNHFYGRRYPGVYADMAWDRILWAEEHGWGEQAKVFREIREEGLPEWLRQECTRDAKTLRERASLFPETGVPYRAEHFL